MTTNIIEKLQSIQANPPDNDGTFILITYTDWNYQSEVTVKLETQADGSVVASCSNYDEPGLFESYADAWWHFADAEITRLECEE